jgi:hypothetical protein
MEPHRSTPRRAAALALGSLTTLGLSLVQAAASVPGWLVGVVGVAALVAIPVSRECSRRLAIVLLVVLGWAPLLWLLQWPTGNLTRFGGMTAVVVGGLVAWVALGPVRARVAALVPRFRRADGVALAGIGLVLAYLAPLLRIRSYPDAVGVVLGGWDHVGHYDMARMIVHGGRLIPFLPPGESGPWYYDSYPQGLHSSVAMLMELSQGIGGGSGIGEVAAYLQATTFVYAATLAMLVTGLCAMPVVRRRPLRAAWAVAALLVAWLVSPGGAILHQAGYDNFLLATAGVAVVPMLLTGRGRLALTGPMVAASGAVMAVAHNWVLLLPLAGAALLAAVWPVRRRRYPADRRGRLAVGGLVAVTGVGAAAAVGQVLSARGADHLLAPGGFPTHNAMGYLVPIVLALVAAALRGQAGVATGGAAVGVGAVVVAWLAATQIAATGQLGYYGVKMLSAVLLVALTSLVLVAVVGGPARWVTGRPGRWAPAALVALALATTTALPLARQRSDFPSVRVRQTWAGTGSARGVSSALMVERMLAAPVGSRPAFFLPADSSESGLVAQLNLWQTAMRGTWSQPTETCWQSISKGSGPDADRLVDLADSVAASRRILGCEVDALVVVPTGRDTLVRTAVPALTGRILEWEPAP